MAAVAAPSEKTIKMEDDHDHDQPVRSREEVHRPVVDSQMTDVVVREMSEAQAAEHAAPVHHVQAETTVPGMQQEARFDRGGATQVEP